MTRSITLSVWVWGLIVLALLLALSPSGVTGGDRHTQNDGGIPRHMQEEHELVVNSPPPPYERIDATAGVKQFLDDAVSDAQVARSATTSASAELPIVAILTILSSSNVSDASNQTLPLFTLMLPSLILSLDCGYRYVVVVGHDEHDEFYDTEQGRQETISWFHQEVESVLDDRGITISLELIKIKRSEGQSGTGTGRVVNILARVAYDIGATFYFRVNDDTEFVGRWPAIFASSLQSLSLEPNLSPATVLGVLGPMSVSAPKADILMTHHFFHRTHLEIFSMNCYPPDVMGDEYLMSFWMSSIYGGDRTLKMTKFQASASDNNFDTDLSLVVNVIASSQIQIGNWLQSQKKSKGEFAKASEGKPLPATTICQLVDSLPNFPNLIMECDGGDISERASYCANTRKQYGVIPHKSKGSMSKAQLGTWKANACGNMFHRWYAFEISTNVVSPKVKKRRNRKGVATTYSTFPMPDCLEHTSQSAQPLIAILAGSTSRKEKLPSNATLSVFTLMLPSLMHSLDCGFRYTVVIGYDKGDNFFDSEKGQNETRVWFQRNVRTVLGHRGLSINLELVKVNNILKKPGPVFVEIARKAYDLGADFMYRVNDDTEFHGRWPKLYSETLMSLSKPYGVIGPRCTPTQNRILTHDFVHRTHMEIFNQTYYPVELVDWWMDDWISSVYGISRTFMSKTVTVIHHVEHHGRRYEVNESNQELLQPLATAARHQIVTWMKNPQNDVSSNDITKFIYEGQASFKHKLRYVNSSGVFEEYYQIGGRKGKKKAPDKASVGRYGTIPLSSCVNFSLTTGPSIANSLIAVMVATTSRSEPYPSPSKLSLFTLMLPSLIRSLDCGFRYIVVVGYDDDDIYYGIGDGLSVLSNWFARVVHAPMKDRGINIELELVKVNNILKKPGPVFVEIARKAYDLGADFMYRVNDDTEFHGRWPKLYSETLMSLSKPYGVIGPRSTTTQNRILTHDFVHRTHMEIFNQTYYPVELVDWWMDDWISSVYGVNRTFMSKTVTVIHHVKYHGQRYEVDNSNRKLLGPLITTAREQIRSWIKHPKNEFNSKFIDEFHYNKTYAEIDKLRYISEGNVIEKYYPIGEDIDAKKAPKKKPSSVSKSKSRPAATSKTGGKKFSKPTTFHKLPMPSCNSDNAKMVDSSFPLIAILSGSTSRSELNPSNSTLSIFTIMLPSLMRSLDCRFRYIVVIGYDEGDKFYDTNKGHDVVYSWFKQQMQDKLLTVGISINLELVKVNNILKKPGPVFLEIARKAYDMGADFMYRVNDDTEFHGRWPKLYSETLMSLSKPYGVIGPRSTTTQNRILTHDFVHRTHMEIFNQTYYPVELVDWWMDDWISSVYGISRTFMSKTVTVIHHVKYHGRRYEVNESNQEFLKPLVAKAKSQIVTWMKNPQNDVSTNVVSNFVLEGTKFNADKLKYVTGIGKFEKYYQIKEKTVAKLAIDNKKVKSQKRYDKPKKKEDTKSTAVETTPVPESSSATSSLMNTLFGNALSPKKDLSITPKTTSAVTKSTTTSKKLTATIARAAKKTPVVTKTTIASKKSSSSKPFSSVASENAPAQKYKSKSSYPIK